MTRVTGAEQPLTRAPAEQFLVNLRNALLMFNATTDSAWFHSPLGRPALETVGGALVVLGAATALWLARRGDWRSAALLASVPLLLLSSVLALAFPDENPSLTRTAGALPAVACLAGLALAFAGRRLSEAARAGGSAAFLALCAALFIWMERNTVQRYFGEYGEQYAISAPNTGEIAAVVNGFLALGGDRAHAYIVGWPFGPDYRAVGLLIGDLGWEGNLWEGDGQESARAAAAAGHAADPARKLYIVGGQNALANVRILQDLYPDAVVTRHPSAAAGHEFSSVFVPGEARVGQP
jgi:hypothetical protein